MKRNKLNEKLEDLLVTFTESLTGETDGAVRLSPERSDEEVSSLLETVRTISSVIQPRPLSQEFKDKVLQAAQERLQEQVSTEKIQRIIGMAVTMEDFRRRLFQDIVAACRSVGLSLTSAEVAALRNLKEDAIKEFANSLDERITKFFPTNLP